MAQIPLKSIKFPGLPDTYTIDGGLSEEAKAALLACFANVAWANESGQDYYDALYNALYPDTGLIRINAVFTQGSAVIYPSTPLNELKAYLVVTGFYNDGTSRTITDYSLGGTLEVGTSTVTVIKDGKTTTFNVTVSQPYWDYEWSAASGIAPTMMQAYTYNFTDYASENAMFVDNFYIDFNHIGNCEILITAKSVAPLPDTSRTPQMSIRGAQNTTGYDGFKIVYNTPSGKVETSASGTFEATSIDYNVYHEYMAKYENGVCYAYIDGTLVGQGSGVVNNAYLYMTGIFGTHMVDGHPDISGSMRYTRMAIKEIKFKVLS